MPILSILNLKRPFSQWSLAMRVQELWKVLGQEWPTSNQVCSFLIPIKWKCQDISRTDKSPGFAGYSWSLFIQGNPICSKDKLSETYNLSQSNKGTEYVKSEPIKSGKYGHFIYIQHWETAVKWSHKVGHKWKIYNNLF